MFSQEAGKLDTDPFVDLLYEIVEIIVPLFKYRRDVS